MSRIVIKTGILIMVAASLCGCDFFRTLAGRPTSADIAAKKEKLELEESLHRNRIDSLNSVQSRMADSLSFADSLRSSGSSIVKAGSLSGLSAAQLSHRYYIVVGAFSNEANLEKQANAAKAAGYEVITVELKSHYKAVMLCPSDNLAQIYASLKAVKKEKFCPPDAWVLVNE